jgi:hypothetical protein
MTKKSADLIDMHYVQMGSGGHNLWLYGHIDELVSWGCHNTDKWGETEAGISDYEKCAKHLQAALAAHMSSMGTLPLMGGVIAFKAPAKKVQKIERIRGVVQPFDAAYDLLMQISPVFATPMPGDELLVLSVLASAIARLEYAMTSPPGFPVRMARVGDGVAPKDRAPYESLTRRRGEREPCQSGRKPYQAGRAPYTKG